MYFNILFRIYYQGYPLPDEERKKMAEQRARDVVKGKDTARAYEKVPRGHYKGWKLLKSFVLRKLNNSVIFHFLRGSYFVLVKFSVYACF